MMPSMVITTISIPLIFLGIYLATALPSDVKPYGEDATVVEGLVSFTVVVSKLLFLYWNTLQGWGERK